MLKKVSALAVLAVLWLGYIIWPLHDLRQLARSFETRNVAVLTTHVNFPSVRVSLTQQIVQAYLKRSGAKVSPMLQGAAAGAASSIADPVIAKLISPEAFAAFINSGWPVTVIPEKPAGTFGITRQNIGTGWQIFAAADYGAGRFEIALPATLPDAQRFVLAFRLSQWRWRLVRVTLPEKIQDLLADELIKTLKPSPVTP